MGDEHLSTIPETESDELIKSSVDNLVPIPSESGDFSNIKSECDDVSKEIYSNPLFDEEIISDKIDDSIISSPKIDSLLEEFSGELAHIDLIPPGINKADFDLEKKIHLDNDSLMEEIDLFLTPDDSMPPGIKNDDYDSEGDIFFLEKFLSNDSPSLPENESFHFDVPSSPRPPVKPPDDGIYFEPDTRVLTTKVVGDISEHYVLMPRLLPTQPALCPVIDTLLLFSSEYEDKVHLLSHWGFKDFNLFSESPMMIYGGPLASPWTNEFGDCPDCDDSHACGFCPSITRASHPQLHFGNLISKSDPID
ncbi:hypothetical protein Tco_0553851 [Tanacetum coccineum]